jgi:hypothetical protein
VKTDELNDSHRIRYSKPEIYLTVVIPAMNEEVKRRE